MKKLIFILFFLGLFFGCTYHSDKIVSINAKERNKIFRNKYFENSDTSFQIENNKLLFIKKLENIECDKFKLFIFEKTGNIWAVMKDTVFTTGFNISLESTEMVTLNGKKYLYYEEYQPGGSSGNFDLEFTLLDFSSIVKYFIHYSEYPNASYTVTEFKKSKNIESNQILLSFIEGKIINSLRIHKPDSEEIFIKQFVAQNEKAMVEMAKPHSVLNPVKFKLLTTKEKIFDINSIKTTKDTISSITNCIQNKDYLLISIFKGPILGYNKLTKEYICVWVPEFEIDWVDDMHFDQAGNLVLIDSWSNKPAYLINLQNSTYTRLK